MLCMIIALVMVMTLIPRLPAGMAFAAQGDTPLHHKGLTNNGDGTYKLSLDVKGETETYVNKVNVLVILDTSTSMNTGAGGGATRISAAKNAINSLARALLGVNGQGDNPSDTVEMALLRFGTHASVVQQPTSSQNTYTSAVNNITIGQNQGTNWEEAFQTADDINFDDDRTFVIFVSDGNPTFRLTRGNYNPMDQYYYSQWNVYGNGSDSQTVQGITAATTIARCYEHAVDDATALANKYGTDNFYTIGAYGSVDRMQQLTTAAGAPANHYFSAANTADLEAALASILADIQKAGFGSVSINDPTTSNVATSAGISHLLTVDDKSFKYYKNGVEWTSSDDPAPPPARLDNDGNVIWDLSSLGLLDNDVVYEVRFDAWPSQYTYDLIADLKNGDKDYNSLDPEIKKYLIKDGDEYTLLTNKSGDDAPTISWDDTRDDEGIQTDKFINPDPVVTTAEEMDVTKVWFNDLDDKAKEEYPDGFNMDVVRDNEVVDTVTVAPDDWADSIYISTGLMRVQRNAAGEITEVQVLEEGHDYSLKEPANLAYHWELVIENIHPMLINGVLYSMVRVLDADIPSGMSEDDDFYVIGDEELFRIGDHVYKIKSQGNKAAVSAYNERKANLNLMKTVTGNADAAPDDAEFEYTITVNNSHASEGSASDLDSDYWLWFSVYDTINRRTVSGDDLTVSGTGLEGPNTDGYYHIPSGNTITVKLQDGWNLRFTNLPTGSTYVIEESSDMEPGFVFDSIDDTTTFQVAELPDGAVAIGNDQYSYDGVIYTKSGDKYQATYTAPVTGMKVEGKIVSPNASYQVTYKNEYTPTKITPQVTKEVTGWDALEAFTFSIEAGDDATAQAIEDEKIIMPNPATVTTGTGMEAGDTKTLDFGDITFNVAGEYTFTVKETNTSAPAGWTYANKATDAKTITVVVAPGEDGKLAATVTGNNPTFTNSYEAGPVNAKIPVKKNITPQNSGAGDITGKFTFTLAAGTNTAGEGVVTPMPSSNTVLCGADGATVEFGDITFSAPGTYTYTVKESVTSDPDAGSVDGITLETKEPKTITIVVTDDGSGTLKAVVNGGAVLEFNNPYTVEEIPVTIPVEKILNVPEGLTAPDITNKFTFTLTAGTNTAAGNIPTPVPTTTSYTNPDADGGEINFGPIIFAVPGEYNYTITETGSADGVTNDSQTTQTVKVTITDNGDGSLSATFDKENIQFVNKYDVEPITASIPVEKILNVGAGLNAPDITDEFTFELTAAEGTPMPTVTSYTNPEADGGDMSFGEITYTKPGTYTYTVTETGTVDGVSAVGTTTKTVEVVVSDSAADGTMTVTVNGGNKLTFTNEYKVNETTAVIPVNKILEVPAGLTPGDITGRFTFTLAAGTNTAAGDIATPMPETKSYTNPDPNGGKVTFGSEDDPITFTAPGTYTYTITETGSAPGVTNDTEATKTITIVVTDLGDGNLEAVVNGGEDVEFTNTYNVEPTTVSFPAKKELEVPAGTTGPDITREYDIILTAGSNNAGEGVVTPMPEVTSYKNPDRDGGVVTFGTITYTKPGIYNYTVSEDGTVPGVSNDLSASGKPVTVTVVDNGNGTLTATASSTTDDPVTFVNTYSYGTITQTPAVHKDLVTPEGKTLTPPDITEEYTFTLKGKTGTEPMPAAGGETVKNPASDGGTVSFGTITFTAPGTYEYEVREAGEVDGVTNDTVSPKTFTITVSDNLQGGLTASIDYGNEAGHVIFTNTYDVEPTTVNFPVKKVVSVPSGMTGPTDWSYTIDVAAVDGAPAAETMTGTVTKAAPTTTFGPFSYNAPGTYTYTVTETGEIAGVTNEKDEEGNPAVKTVTVTVTDNGNGTLSASADSTEASPATFTNTYDVEPTTAKFPVEKIMTVPAGMAGPANWSYTINVAVAEGSPAGTPVAETMTGTVTKAAPTTSFGDFTYTVPGTYTYTVSETGTVQGVTNDTQAAGKTVTVEVVDNGNGTMTATASSTDETPLQFNNSYNVEPVQISFPVKKIMSVPAGLKGPKEWSYSINVAAVDGAPVAETMTGTVTNTADTATFGPFSYNAPGEYKYTVTESGTIAGVDNDEAATTGKTVTVTVTDNGDGSLSVSADSTATSPVTFTNTYEVEPTTASFPVEKIMSVPAGMDGPTDWTYTINVAAVNGAPVAETMTGSVTKAAPTATFGDFTYTAPGTYTYKVTETGTIKGVTNDEEATTGKIVTVTVVDNQNGTLTATADSTTEEPLQFTNNYNVEPTTAKIPVEKILEVPEGLTAPDITNKFTFELAAGDNTAAGDIDTPMPTVTSYTNPDKTGGTVSFGDITYTAPGSYTYTVTETGEVKGVSNDSVGTKTVTVNVVDNKDGTLTATVNGGQTLQFVNSYSVGETTAVIPVVKILEVPEGLDGPDDITEEFTFTLTAGTNTAAGSIDTPMPKDAEGNVVREIKNPAADGGSAQFATITFAKPGTYNYNITETGEVDGVTNDKNASQDIQIVVVDNSDGTLTATVNKGQEVKFTNTYGVEPTTAKFPVEKNMVVPEGLDGPKDWKYDIKVVAQDGAPAAKTMEGTVTKAAPSVTFGDFTYDMPGEYKYIVSETGTYPGVENDKDAAGKTVTVTVVDNKDGTLTATPNYSEDEPLVFTNTYSVDPTKANFPVEKILEVPEGLDPDSIEGKFTFTLTADEGTPMPKVTEQTNPSKDGGTVTFGDIEYALPGTYNYTVTESGSAPGVTNDATASKPVKVVVVDNGNGTLTATPDYDEDNPLQFTNKYSVEPTTAEFPVKKIMEVPEELDGPETWTYEIKVEAQKGAPEAETMTGEVTEKADTATFGDFTYTKPGTYEYKVTETGDIKGVTNDKEATKTVTVTVVDNGDGTLTATADSTTDKPLTFTNKYSADPVEVETKAKLKKVVKSMPPKAKSVDFEFTLQEEGSEEVLKATVTATETGEYGIDFGALKFTKPGTHTYTLTEVLDNLDGGWVVEKSPAKITIKVTDNKAGQLVAEADSADIINTFDTVEITGEKVWDDAEYFDENGKPLKGYERPDVTINLMADGKKVDSVKVTAKDDWKFTFTDLPKYKDHGTEIVYSVTEAPVDGYDANVDGTTVTNTPFEKKDIINPTFLTIFKVDVDGNDVGLAGAEFTLSGDALDEDVVYTTGEDGTVKIDIEKDGSYTLTETKAPEGYEIPDDATYTIEVEKEFVKVELDKAKNVWNWIYDLIFGEDSSVFDRDAMRLTVEDPSEKISVTAEKIWNDEDDKDGLRPDKITLTITGWAGDEEVYSDMVKVKENEDGDWTYTWEDLNKYCDGEEIVYEVSEKKVADYKTKIGKMKETSDGYKVKITNTHKPKKTPKTGDTTQVLPYMLMFTTALLGLLLALRRKEQKK